MKKKGFHLIIYRLTTSNVLHFIANSNVALRILAGKKTPSNKTPMLSKSMNMDISVVSTLIQLFIRGSYLKLKQNFRKKKVVTGKILFFVIGDPFCSPHFICLSIGF